MVEDIALSGFSFAHLYDEVPSTMDVARESMKLLKGGAGVVCARRQRSGRGRQGRAWSSPPGAMMATFLFHTSAPVSALSGYSLVVGLALVEAFGRFGAQLRLKWPNDLVVVRDGSLKKIGGILIEVQESGADRVVLVGVGVNLIQAPLEVPHASTIEEISGRPVTLEEALRVCGERLKHAHETFIASGGFSAFREPWEAVSCFEKSRTEVRLDLGERQILGRYVGLDHNGSLLLRIGDEVQPFHSGHLLECSGLRE